MLPSTFSTRPLSKVNCYYHHQTDCDAQKRVGEIEGGPSQIIVDTHVDKVSHQAVIEKAVVQIAAYPGGKKSERNVHDFLSRTAEQENAEYRGKCKERYRNQPI